MRAAVRALHSYLDSSDSTCAGRFRTGQTGEAPGTLNFGFVAACVQERL